MRYLTSPITVVLGLMVVTAAGVAPNAELSEAYSAIARLEARIAKLEAASVQGQTVRAPFQVVDHDGSVILRVTGGTSPMLDIGGEKTGGVLMGGTPKNGWLRVRDVSDTTGGASAAIIAQKGTSQLRLVGRSFSATLTAADKEQGAVLSLFAGDTPSARLRTGLEGHGGLILTDKSGYPMVRAGVLKGDAVGVVWTGPRMRPGSMGPSVIQGAK